MTLTITEFAAMGGKARWKGTTKKQRSKAMSELARLSRNKSSKSKKAVDTPQLEHTEVIQQVI